MGAMPLYRQTPVRRRSKSWWKTHEEVSHLFEKLFRPLEQHVLHDIRERDVVGKLRQLDVGVIDPIAGERRVKALVEVQKRKRKVDVGEFGSWIYKRDTLQASELVIVSEQGFTKAVVSHAKNLHSDRVRLGQLYEVETGWIEASGSTLLGITRMLDVWWFASIFVRYTDTNDVGYVRLETVPDTEEKIFGPASPMDLIRHAEKELGDQPSGRMNALCINAPGLSYENRPIDWVMITAEKQRRIWDAATRFYSYKEVFPKNTQRGIAVISEFRVDASRSGALTLVIVPDPNVSAGNYANIAGQLEFS